MSVTSLKEALYRPTTQHDKTLLQQRGQRCHERTIDSMMSQHANTQTPKQCKYSRDRVGFPLRSVSRSVGLGNRTARSLEVGGSVLSKTSLIPSSVHHMNRLLLVVLVSFLFPLFLEGFCTPNPILPRHHHQKQSTAVPPPLAPHPRPLTKIQEERQKESGRVPSSVSHSSSSTISRPE